MQLKEGVIFNLGAPMLRALPVIEEACYIFDVEPWITSGSDGEHMEGSLHYDKRAIDIRSRDLHLFRIPFVKYLKLHLGPGYDVIDEHIVKAHIHIEWDPT